VAGDLPAADALWRTLATDPRRRRMAETELHAELASLEASLRTDQRRFSRAEWLLARAARWYKALGEGDGEAKALVKWGLVRLHRGEPEGAIPVHERAATLLDPERSPRLHLAVQHNLALCEADLGRFQAAAERLAAARDLYERLADPWSAPLVAWLEARIARGLGEHSEAARHFTRARDAYIAYGLGLDAGLVSLDLADLYLETGRIAEVKQLARAIEPVFRFQDVGREATAALVLFQRAAGAERLTAAFVARLRGFLDRTRRAYSSAAKPG
jgi:tetratricopeptide (TPR) repeat protein